MLIQLTLVLADVVLINVTFLLAFLLRYGIPVPEYNFSPYKDNFAFLTFLYMLSFIFAKAFKKRYTSFWNLFKSIFISLFLGTLFGIALVYVFRARWASFPSSVFVRFP